MVNAIILMTCERHRIAEVGEKLAGMEEIAEVYSVAGDFVWRLSCGFVKTMISPGS